MEQDPQCGSGDTVWPNVLVVIGDNIGYAGRGEATEWSLRSLRLAVFVCIPLHPGTGGNPTHPGNWRGSLTALSCEWGFRFTTMFT